VTGSRSWSRFPTAAPPGGPAAALRAGPTAQSPTSAEPAHEEEFVGFTRSGIPVWRCKVCGYLCARAQTAAQMPESARLTGIGSSDSLENGTRKNAE
jgi:hypothetical protein